MKYALAVLAFVFIVYLAAVWLRYRAFNSLEDSDGP